jgi:hypothetical protein
MYIIDRTSMSMKAFTSLSSMAVDGTGSTGSLFIFNDKHVIDGLTSTQTFDFDARKRLPNGTAHPDVKYLAVGNYIVFRDKGNLNYTGKGRDRLFTIMSTKSDDLVRSVHCEGMTYDLINESVGTWSGTRTFGEWVNEILPGANISLDSATRNNPKIMNYQVEMNINETESKLSRWQKLLDACKFQSDFYVSIFSDGKAPYNSTCGLYLQAFLVEVWRIKDRRPGDTVLDTFIGQIDDDGEVLKSERIAQRYENYYDLDKVYEETSIVDLCTAVELDFSGSTDVDTITLENEWRIASISARGYKKLGGENIVCNPVGFNKFKRFKALTGFVEGMETQARVPDGSQLGDGYISCLHKPTAKTVIDLYDECCDILDQHGDIVFTYEITLKQDYETSLKGDTPLGGAYFGANKTFAYPGSYVQIVHHQFAPAFKSVDQNHDALYLQAQIAQVTYVYTQVGKDTCTLSNIKRLNSSIMNITNQYVVSISSSSGSVMTDSGTTLTAQIKDKKNGLLLDIPEGTANYHWTRKSYVTGLTDETWSETSASVDIPSSGGAYTYTCRVTATFSGLSINASGSLDLQKKDSYGLVATLNYPDGTVYKAVETGNKRITARLFDGNDSIMTLLSPAAFTWTRKNSSGNPVKFNPAVIDRNGWSISATKEDIVNHSIQCSIDESKLSPKAEIKMGQPILLASWSSGDIKKKWPFYSTKGYTLSAQQQIQIIDDTHFFVSYSLVEEVNSKGQVVPKSYALFKMQHSGDGGKATPVSASFIYCGLHGDGFVYDKDNNAIYTPYSNEEGTQNFIGSFTWMGDIADDKNYIYQNTTEYEGFDGNGDIESTPTPRLYRFCGLGNYDIYGNDANKASTFSIVNYVSTAETMSTVKQEGVAGQITNYRVTKANLSNLYPYSNMQAVDYPTNLTDKQFGLNPSYTFHDNNTMEGQCAQSFIVHYPYVFLSLGRVGQSVNDWGMNSEFMTATDPRSIWCINMETQSVIFKHKFSVKELIHSDSLFYNEMEGIDVYPKRDTYEGKKGLYFGYRFRTGTAGALDYLYRCDLTFR